MINRELIRIKVVQLTYAYYQNGEKIIGAHDARTPGECSGSGNGEEKEKKKHCPCSNASCIITTANDKI